MRQLLFGALLFCIMTSLNAQENKYYLFEFMEVEPVNETSYLEVEDSWKKLHQIRKQKGDIDSWTLWSLQPGGTSQGAQYMTITVFNSLEDMFTGGDFEGAFQKAYSGDQNEFLMKTNKSRDISNRFYTQELSTTKDNYDRAIGTVARVNFMKAATEDASPYERAERNIFRPIHQSFVDNGIMADWSLFRVFLPGGSDAYATHMTIDMFADFEKMFIPTDPMYDSLSEDRLDSVERGSGTRSLRKIYYAKLVDKVE